MVYTYIARKIEEHAGSVTLEVITDETTVVLKDGDEFVSVTTVVPLFNEDQK